MSVPPELLRLVSDLRREIQTLRTEVVQLEGRVVELESQQVASKLDSEFDLVSSVASVQHLHILRCQLLAPFHLQGIFLQSGFRQRSASGSSCVGVFQAPQEGYLGVKGLLLLVRFTLCAKVLIVLFLTHQKFSLLGGKQKAW